MKALICFFLSLSLSCAAEVAWVSATWWAEGIPHSTQQLLERRLKTMAEARRHEIDMANGKAVLYWKPNVKYSDKLVRSILGWAGISSYETRIKVRGVVEVKEKQLYLTSLGDGTEFPLYSQNNDAKLRPVLQQHELEPRLKRRLEQAAKNQELVTVEGPLFMSLRPPVGIDAEKVEYDE